MKRDDVRQAIDIHSCLDQLEMVSTLQEYYKLNHTTPHQRDRITQRLAEVLAEELTELGIEVES